MLWPNRRLSAAGAVFLALAAARCTSSSTSVTAPTSSKCAISVSSSPSSFTAGGGSGTVSVTTDRDCTWSAATDASWIALGATSNGQGEASIPYSVAANPAPVARSGNISVGSEKIQLSQAAAPCTFRLSRSADSISADGGRLSFDLATLSGCGWSAASDAGWLSIVSGANGNASASITVSAAPNSGDARVAHVNAGGQIYTVQQGAKAVAPPPPSPAPPPPSPPPPTPPPPPPSPPPPSDNSIDLDGTAVALVGRCPDLAFFADGHWVIVSAATDFKKGKCSDLSGGDQVKVHGRLRPNGVVDADQIELKKQR
ncbi:MAG TPA: BACON domain-containing carbohydrate-binding protein [Vicinamibacterales bacterium]